MEIQRILSAMGIPGWNAEAFVREEDGTEYEVWKVRDGETVCVLKKAKGMELDVYRSFLSGGISGAPRLLKAACIDGEDYILTEYIPGKDLCRCDRVGLQAVLDALIRLQKAYWEDTAHADAGFSFDKSLPGRENRKNYLKDPELEQAYDRYLELYHTVPRTLCHDDLLPFNVRISGETAAIIDWEVGGILPYPSPLARLIAHSEENADAFFFMTEADKAFAVDYYYDNLIRGKGISYADYREALDAFLLYEYCEWIMLGNRYEDTDRVRFLQYRKKAKDHLRKMK